MRFLLDENFPLALYHRLREAGFDAEHVIAGGRRGVPDSVLLERMAAEALVFLTHDAEFEDLVTSGFRSQVVISRVPQGIPTRERVEIWFRALQEFSRRKPPERLFDLMPDGSLAGWEILEGGSRTRVS